MNSLEVINSSYLSEHTRFFQLKACSSDISLVSSLVTTSSQGHSCAVFPSWNTGHSASDCTNIRSTLHLIHRQSRGTKAPFIAGDVLRDAVSCITDPPTPDLPTTGTTGPPRPEEHRDQSSIKTRGPSGPEDHRDRDRRTIDAAGDGGSGTSLGQVTEKTRQRPEVMGSTATPRLSPCRLSSVYRLPSDVGCRLPSAVLDCVAPSVPIYPAYRCRAARPGHAARYECCRCVFVQPVGVTGGCRTGLDRRRRPVSR